MPSLLVGSKLLHKDTQVFELHLSCLACLIDLSELIDALVDPSHRLHQLAVDLLRA